MPPKEGHVKYGGVSPTFARLTRNTGETIAQVISIARNSVN